MAHCILMEKDGARRVIEGPPRQISLMYALNRAHQMSLIQPRCSFIVTTRGFSGMALFENGAQHELNGAFPPGKLDAPKPKKRKAKETGK